MVGPGCFRIALATILIGTGLGIVFGASQLMVVLVIIGVAGFFACNRWTDQ